VSVAAEQARIAGRGDSVALEAPAEPGGARGVWLTAAGVGTVLAALLLWQLLVPRAYLTGSNSVGVRSVVATVRGGQTLCVPRLTIPPGTGGVRFAVFGDQAASLRLRVETAAGARTARAVATPVGGGRLNADGFFAGGLSAGPAAGATACLTPLGADVRVGGTGALQGDQAPARLDGAAVAQRVSVWFLPPAGAKRSLLASLGDVFARAALFRPGVVGAWTYPLLLFVVLPLTWLLALLAMARAAAGHAGRPPAWAVVALVAFVNAAAWALTTPAFNTPDEPDHFAYVQQLAETGTQLRQAPDATPTFSTDLTLALDGVRAYSQVGLGDARPPWQRSDERHWERVRAGEAHPTDNGGGYAVAASSHAPLYYGLLAPAYLAVGHASTFSQLTAARLVSALLGAIVAVCAFGIVRELLPRRRLAALAAGLLLAFQPMLMFIAGGVNNDNGVNAAAAVTLYLLVRGLRRGPTWRSMVALAAAVVALPVMKGTGLELYPVVAVGLLGMLWRHHDRASLPAWGVLAGTFVALRAAWAALAPTFHAAAAGGGSAVASPGSSVELALHHPFRYLSYLWQYFLPRLPLMDDLFVQRWPAFDVYVTEGWASFGWVTVAFPRWVYVAIVLAMIVVALLAAAAVVRERVVARALGWELAVLALAPICVIAAVEAAYLSLTGRTVLAEQGRYAFPAATALAAIAVGGSFGLGRRWHVPLATALVVAVMGFGYAARFVALAGFYT
jgi:hypothetical protein